jgi:hypothetical protein
MQQQLHPLDCSKLSHIALEKGVLRHPARRQHQFVQLHRVFKTNNLNATSENSLTSLKLDLIQVACILIIDLV